MPAKPQRFVTVGTIARENDCSIHNVEYAIRSRKIEPMGMAGNARVFSEQDVKRIVLVLKEIKSSTKSRRLH